MPATEPSEEPLCQICGETIATEGAVYCGACLTPHHRECWVYAGGCSTYGCGGKLCLDRPEDDSPWRDALVIKDGDLVEASDATDVLPAPGTGLNLRHPLARLDLDTPLEVTLLLLAIFAGLGCFMCLVQFFVPGILACLLACWGFSRAYKSTDCTYVVDNVGQKIDYYRKFLGHVTRYPVCSFKDVAWVTTRGKFCKSKHSSWWEYGVALVRRDGKILEVTNTWRDGLSKADSLAAILARHLGAGHQAGKAQTYLSAQSDGKGEVILRHEPHSLIRHGLLPVLAIVGAVVALIGVAVGVLVAFF